MAFGTLRLGGHPPRKLTSGKQATFDLGQQQSCLDIAGQLRDHRFVAGNGRYARPFNEKPFNLGSALQKRWPHRFGGQDRMLRYQTQTL